MSDGDMRRYPLNEVTVLDVVNSYDGFSWFIVTNIISESACDDAPVPIEKWEVKYWPCYDVCNEPRLSYIITHYIRKGNYIDWQLINYESYVCDWSPFGDYIPTVGITCWLSDLDFNMIEYLDDMLISYQGYGLAMLDDPYYCPGDKIRVGRGLCQCPEGFVPIDALPCCEEDDDPTPPGELELSVPAGDSYSFRAQRVIGKRGSGFIQPPTNSPPTRTTLATWSGTMDSVPSHWVFVSSQFFGPDITPSVQTSGTLAEQRWRLNGTLRAVTSQVTVGNMREIVPGVWSFAPVGFKGTTVPGWTEDYDYITIEVFFGDGYTEVARLQATPVFGNYIASPPPELGCRESYGVGTIRFGISTVVGNFDIYKREIESLPICEQYPNTAVQFVLDTAAYLGADEISFGPLSYTVQEGDPCACP